MSASNKREGMSIMENKLPLRRLIICAAIAIVSVGLGIFIIFYLPYSDINDAYLALTAAVGMTAVSEIFAALSRFPIVSYIISAILCSAALQAMTPWNMIMPFADMGYPEKIFAGYRYSVISCLVIYSAALVVSVLFGIFVLHRKDIFRSDK